MVKLFFENIKLHFKILLEYKTSFILSFFSNCVLFFSFYFTTMALFTTFNNIKGFTIYEVLLCFGIINFGVSFNELFFRGIDQFDEFVIGGALDRFLVRPVNVLYQVICAKIDFVKLARFLCSIGIIIYALVKLNITLNISKIITLILMLSAAIIVFFSLMLISASYCFITIQGLEVRNTIFDGSKYAAQYPMGIYKKGMKLFFTAIIPLAFVNYYPLLYFLDKTNNQLYMFSPLLTIIFLIPGFILFNIGLKHYSSAGS